MTKVVNPFGGGGISDEERAQLNTASDHSLEDHASADPLSGLVTLITETHWRFVVTGAHLSGGNDFNMNDVRFYSDVGATQIISLTGRTATAVPAQLGGEAVNAFNQNPNDGCRMNAPNTEQILNIVLPGAIAPSAYSVQGNGTTSYPTDWRLESSSDNGNTWDVADTQAGIGSGSNSFVIPVPNYPANPVDGQQFFNKTTGKQMRWIGAAWVVTVVPAGGTTAEKNALTPYLGQAFYDTDLAASQNWNGNAWV